MNKSKVVDLSSRRTLKKSEISSINRNYEEALSEAYANQLTLEFKRRLNKSRISSTERGNRDGC